MTSWITQFDSDRNGLFIQTKCNACAVSLGRTATILDTSSSFGFQRLSDLIGFALRNHVEPGQFRVVLCSKNGAEECIGLTNQEDNARDWIEEANALIQAKQTSI